jgi:Mg2+ and Co2+ transporter CorA
LVEKFNIDPYIIEKFIGKSHRNKALILGNHLFLTLSIPDLQNGQYEKQELKFILGESHMITSSDAVNEGMEVFKKRFEDNKHFKKSEESDSPVIYSFLHLIEKVYANMILELHDINTEIDSIEKKIFSEQERKMVYEISQTNKKLIDFGKHMRGHEET